MTPNHQNVEMLGTDGFTNLPENWQTVSDCSIRFCLSPANTRKAWKEDVDAAGLKSSFIA
jgi:hypothetical protein